MGSQDCSALSHALDDPNTASSRGLVLIGIGIPHEHNCYRYKAGNNEETTDIPGGNRGRQS